MISAFSVSAQLSLWDGSDLVPRSLTPLRLRGNCAHCARTFGDANQVLYRTCFFHHLRQCSRSPTEPANCPATATDTIQGNEAGLPGRFNLLAQLLHWTMAVAILAMLFIGVAMI